MSKVPHPPFSALAPLCSVSSLPSGGTWTFPPGVSLDRRHPGCLLDLGLAFPILFLHQAVLQTWLLRCQPVRTSRSPTCVRWEMAWEGRLSSMEGKEVGVFGAARLQRGGDGKQGYEADEELFRGKEAT